ncbi:uncharacterized protein EV154DRAFT_512453 [Mucor mucedo]|uniref:uncharacterized protein n=1 Tax=Mucor mucedo TaxID=29922 RepID=UPI0022211622|nr:uncharacterized protein EV154DRAFT_512453 [Mucor mucedo]KAI7890096.1 hypothetical protein EV154DRAFT_512453 [Mucor mucedo]
MDGNSQNNDNGQNIGGFAYGNYPEYYYPQYYSSSQPQIPQGDPSNALTSMVYQLQQQSQQRQAIGAMAAASISSVIGGRQQQVDYNASYYSGTQDQRSVINYDDLSLTNASASAQEPTKETPDPYSATKPKLCCNRWLKSSIAVAQHEKLHIKCPSCEHMCLKSALQEHEENFHGKEKKESDKKPSRPDGIIPANAPRIETPEELEAWIAARKKNWPSKDNVARKEQEDAEKEARGEISTKKRVANKRKEQQNVKKQKLEEKKNSLVAQYDSDSDSENDIMDLEKDAVSSKDPSAVGKILLPEDRPKRKCKYFLVDKCSKGDECEFSHEKPESKQKQKHPKAAPTFRKKPNLLFKVSFPFPCDQVYISKHYLAFGKRNTTRT